MSGLEIAGLVLGAIPLIIAGLDRREQVARTGRYWRNIREEHRKCMDDVKYHQLLYEMNLKELLLPIVDHPDDVPTLVKDPDHQKWKSTTLESRLKGRLQESYPIYISVMKDINEATWDLREILCPNMERESAPDHSPSPDDSFQQHQVSFWASAKAKMDYQMFRVRFTINDTKRKEILASLEGYNERLEKLLNTSHRVAILHRAATISYAVSSATLETIFKKVKQRAELLFGALQLGWQCACQHSHVVNLKLEHRTVPEICFDMVLMFTFPQHQTVAASNHWDSSGLRCEQVTDCSSTRTSLRDASPRLQSPPHITRCHSASLKYHGSTKKKHVSFTSSTVAIPRIGLDLIDGQIVKLCQRLSDQQHGVCMGIIESETESYHLHRILKGWPCAADESVTLNMMLSHDAETPLSRRQRYRVALLLASTVAQLQSTEWLRPGLTKNDILFIPHEDEEGRVAPPEPYIRRCFATDGGPANEIGSNYNFHSLGILLLELCFGRRLEDHPGRRRFQNEPKEVEQALDLMTALRWSRDVSDEATEDYASAVKWCFMGEHSMNHSWRDDMINHVVVPLQACQIVQL